MEKISRQSDSFIRRSWALIVATGLSLLLAGCAAVTPQSRHEIFWPRSPLEPRIQWLSVIHDRQDAGIAKSFWKKVVEFVAGEEREGIIKPYGVYADRQGRIFVVDVGSAEIHLFDVKNSEYFLIGGGDKRVFQTPIGITGDGEELVFITDSATGTIYRYNVRTRALMPFISGKLERPTGIAYNSRNRLLYITETGRHQVVVFDQGGVERFRIGERGDTAGRFNYPTDLFIDAGGDLYVTDPLNSRIQVFSSSGKFLRMFGSAGDTSGYFSKPKGVAVDREGHVYVCDAIRDSVQIFDKAGRLLLDFGAGGMAPGEFLMPSGIYIDDKDTIYVADTYNQRIQIFRYLAPHDTTRAVPGAATGTASTR